MLIITEQFKFTIMRDKINGCLDAVLFCGLIKNRWANEHT